MRRMTEDYLRQKFSEATSALATGLGPLPERVRNAMVILVMFSPEDMPDKYSREVFARLSYLSTDREAVGDEGQIAATLDAMDLAEVQDLARAIFDVHSHLLRRADQQYAAEQEPGAPV